MVIFRIYFSMEKDVENVSFENSLTGWILSVDVVNDSMKFKLEGNRERVREIVNPVVSAESKRNALSDVGCQFGNAIRSYLKELSSSTFLYAPLSVVAMASQRVRHKIRAPRGVRNELIYCPYKKWVLIRT